MNRNHLDDNQSLKDLYEELNKVLALAEEVLEHAENIKKIQNIKKNYSLVMIVLSYLCFILPLLTKYLVIGKYTPNLYVPIFFAILIGFIFSYFGFISWKQYRKLDTDLRVQEDILANLINHLNSSFEFLNSQNDTYSLEHLIFKTRLQMLRFKAIS